MRDSGADAMRDLPLTRDWSAITLSDGPRGGHQPADHLQRIRFPARPGGYAPGRSISGQRPCIVDANVGNFYEAFLQGFLVVLRRVGGRSVGHPLLTGVAKPDSLQLITTDSAPIITRALARLAPAFTDTCGHHR